MTLDLLRQANKHSYWRCYTRHKTENSRLNSTAAPHLKGELPNRYENNFIAKVAVATTIFLAMTSDSETFTEFLSYRDKHERSDHNLIEHFAKPFVAEKRFSNEVLKIQSHSLISYNLLQLKIQPLNLIQFLKRYFKSILNNYYQIENLKCLLVKYFYRYSNPPSPAIK